MSLRVLITGASGFVGRHLARECAQDGNEVIGLSRSGGLPDELGSGVAVDLRDADATAAAVRAAQPDVVYHLAALSSVGRSWDAPAEVLHDNTAATLSLLEAVRAHAPDACLLATASGELYGPPETLPVDEHAPLHPQNPYAVSKTTADLLAGMYADAYGMRIVRARPFNHAGPGQLPIFIVSSFARQVAEGLLAGDELARIVSGNPDTRRDFTDVRDVVRAYRLLATRGEPGVFNVCSGHTASASELVRMIAEEVAPLPVEHTVDPDLVRGHEVMEIRGSHERLTAATGWHPEIPLPRTIADTLSWWRQELGSTLSAS
jgi:GDP-4-dehydro-6-deoxy-D-mannose reductase